MWFNIRIVDNRMYMHFEWEFLNKLLYLIIINVENLKRENEKRRRK